MKKKWIVGVVFCDFHGRFVCGFDDCDGVRSDAGAFLASDLGVAAGGVLKSRRVVVFAGAGLRQKEANSTNAAADRNHDPLFSLSALQRSKPFNSAS
jgi:hypothetical protein